MDRTTIVISNEIKRLADARAVAAGYATVDEYVGALIRADADQAISPEVESHLLTAIGTPARQADITYWDEKRGQLEKTFGRQKL
jgi:hypothetical protein